MGILHPVQQVDQAGSMVSVGFSLECQVGNASPGRQMVRSQQLMSNSLKVCFMISQHKSCEAPGSQRQGPSFWRCGLFVVWFLMKARCLGCADQLMIGDLVVAVDRFPRGPEYFHPRCLLCSQCGVLLVDLRCFVDVGKVVEACRHTFTQSSGRTRPQRRRTTTFLWETLG